MQTLKDRIIEYEESCDYKLIKKLPLIIQLNGRSFFKTTALLEKPFSQEFLNVIYATVLKLVQEVEGVVFVYHFNDEIILLIRNDQTSNTASWYDNRIQKIVSCVSAIATLVFNDIAKGINLQLVGDAIFLTKICAVPNWQEAINFFIFKQQQCVYKAVNFSVYYELMKKYDEAKVKEILEDLNLEEKLKVLENRCEIDFASYPAEYREGIACYRTPSVDGVKLKQKWSFDTEIPRFSKEQSFLENIFSNGRDIIRAGRDFKNE